MYSLLLSLSLAANVTVTRSESAVQDAIDGAHGSPVLVHFWATWCDACMREFPHFMRLSRTPGLKVVSVSVDLRQGLNKHVKPFLDEQRAEFETLLLDVDSPERVMHALDPGWNGAIPADFVYDKEGRFIRRFLGDGGSALDKVIEKLLPSPNPQ